MANTKAETLNAASQPTLVFSVRSVNLLLDLGNGLTRIEALWADLHHEPRLIRKLDIPAMMGTFRVTRDQSVCLT